MACSAAKLPPRSSHRQAKVWRSWWTWNPATPERPPHDLVQRIGMVHVRQPPDPSCNFGIAPLKGRLLTRGYKVDPRTVADPQR
jgi:hypothetical protein